MLCLIVLTVLLTRASAQNGCPDINVKEGFDVSKYVGEWYGVMTSAPDDLDLKCMKVKYDTEGDYVLINVKSVVISTGQDDYIIGNATAPDKNVPAKMILNVNNKSVQINYWIMDTDYENYLVIFSCYTVSETTNKYVRVLSREKTLSEERKNRILDLVVKNGIATDSIKSFIQDCQN